MFDSPQKVDQRTIDIRIAINPFISRGFVSTIIKSILVLLGDTQSLSRRNQQSQNLQEETSCTARNMSSHTRVKKSPNSLIPP